MCVCVCVCVCVGVGVCCVGVTLLGNILFTYSHRYEVCVFCSFIKPGFQTCDISFSGNSKTKNKKEEVSRTP